LDDGSETCSACEEPLALSGAPAIGLVLCSTSTAETGFAAVELAAGLTALVIGAAPPPQAGTRLTVAPREDGTLEPTG
jgi:hypothetical protein